MKSERIYLIGFMGCGKTTLGKALATDLNYEFIDLDVWFEQENKTTISAYFEMFGEAKFREKESALIAKTSQITNAIISTGGGAPCYNNNMELIKQLGLSIYIKLSPQVLAQRLKNETHSRPLIANKTEAELLEFISSKLIEREPYYEQAQVILNEQNSTVAQYVQAILASL